MRFVMDLPEEIGVIAPSTFLPGDSSRGPIVQYSCDVDIDRLLLTNYVLSFLQDLFQGHIYRRRKGFIHLEKWIWRGIYY